MIPKRKRKEPWEIEAEELARARTGHGHVPGYRSRRDYTKKRLQALAVVKAEEAGLVEQMPHAGCQQERSGSAGRRLRKRILAERGTRCEVCAEKRPDSELHVHHLSYERLGAERDEDVLLVCRDCHIREHGGTPGTSTSAPSLVRNWGYRPDVQTPAPRKISVEAYLSQKKSWPA